MEKRSITYPVSLDYCKHWDSDPGWFIAREVFSNALDSDRATAKMEMCGDDLVISDKGTGMAIKHLILGVSQKEEGAIGQFGEGLKLALVLATRHNVEVIIESGELVIRNSTDEIDGVSVLKLDITSTPVPIVGTRVTFVDWMWKDYTTRFLTSEQDARVLYHTEAGSVLKEHALYCKDVFVKELPNFKYGYDVHTDMKMNRDRAAVEDSNMHFAIGKIVNKLTEKKSIVNFLMAVTEYPNGERRVRFDRYSFYGEVKDTWKSALEAVYGKKLVAATSEKWITQAKYCGFNPVREMECGESVYYAISAWYDLDRDNVMKKLLQNAKPLTRSDLNQIQRENLLHLQKVWKRVKEAPVFEKYRDIKIVPVDLPEDIGGRWCTEDQRVEISPRNLVLWEDTLSTFIHEMAHATTGAEDATKEMVQACTDFGANFLINYLPAKWM